MSEANDESESIDFDSIPSEYLNDFALAKESNDPEAVSRLGKSEAVYWLDNLLTGDTPEGSPSGHNGNVTKAQVKAWAETIARMQEEESIDFEEYREEDEDEDEDEGGDE